MSPMEDFVSVIFTSYNRPQSLQKLLWCFECQTHKNFEIVIADDGSQEATRELVQNFRENSHLRIQHIWHPDEGYQKCPILNKAIVASKADYLIFTDGDCIPRADFVAQHIQRRKQGYFLSGGTLRLPLDLSQHIERSHSQSQTAFELNWLYQTGHPKPLTSNTIAKTIS